MFPRLNGWEDAKARDLEYVFNGCTALLLIPREHPESITQNVQRFRYNYNL